MENTENVQATTKAEPRSDTAVGSNPWLVLSPESEKQQPTSEELYGIAAQPAPGCPLIDSVIAGIEMVLRKTRNYEKLKDESDIEELHDILREVENTLSEYCGRHNKMDEIRTRLEEVRAWGEEWKQYAKKHTKPEQED